jgi:hypothetical protein
LIFQGKIVLLLVELLKMEMRIVRRCGSGPALILPN